MMASSIKRVSIKRQLQQFSVQDKLDAIQRVNEGESKASVARDIGVPESTLRGWCKSEEKLRCSSTELENEGGIIGDGGLAGLCNGTLDVVGPSTKRARSDNPVASCTAATTKDPELDEALWYWLRQQQQHVAGLSEQLCHAAAAQQQQQQQHHHQPTVTSVKSQSSAAAVAAAAAAAVAATTGAMVSSAAADLNPSTGWFWRWYKRYGLTAPDALGKVKPADSALPLMTTNRVTPTTTTSTGVLAPTSSSLMSLSRTPAPAHTPQLAHAHSHSSSQNPAPAHLSVHALAPAHQSHQQQALPAHSACQPTNLHVSSMVAQASSSSAAPSAAAAAAAAPEPDDASDDEDDEPPLSAAEAVAHGEKFLRWLDCCSDPSVTALQILQFRYLLNNVRACAARRAKAAANRDKS
ncbi:hypothetical protein B566_EDAN009091 [Ephemera danica]|nr:hypothetical protein B566_EDAN009091 [Ephemera danica]